MALLTGIDPGTFSIKVVQGQMNGPLFKLTRVAEFPIDPSGDVESEVLRTLQSDLPLLKLKPGTVRVGATGRDLMIRYTSVPPVPLWRLRMLMDFEVQDMSTSSGDTLCADYNILHSEVEDGDETVLVALVKNHFLDSRLRAIKGGGLDVKATTPNCIALFNSFLSFGDMEGGEFTFLADIGDQNIEMSIIRDGELLFSRNVSGGGEMFSKAIAETWGVGVPKSRDLKHDYGNVTPRGRASYESSQEEKVANAIMGVAGQLSGMIQSTMNFARSQNGLRDMQIGRVMISGGGASLTGLDSYLEQNLSIPVLRFVPDAGLDLSALPNDEAELFEENPGRFACALGLARMSSDPDAFLIDIIPEAVKKKRRFMSRHIYMIAASVAAVVFLGILWFSLSAQVTKSAEDLKLAERDKRKATRIKNRYDSKLAEARLVKRKVDQLAWESRGATYLVRGQGLVQRCAHQSIWIRSVELGIKSVSPPGQENVKKSAVEKTLVTVKGEIRQLGEGVTKSFNRFVEGLRSDKLKPVVSIVNSPMDAGGDFHVTIDYAGWPSEEANEEDAE
ncbi:MAG: type IV pilus assembly protein PilM [Planctomycetota bacterium]|jgi:type IV pilus assembly protein PilM